MPRRAEDLRFSDHLASRLYEERERICAQWLTRLRELLLVAIPEILPGRALLDQMPDVIAEIAAGLRESKQEMGSRSQIVNRGRALGELRHSQHASVHQILREQELLVCVLEDFVRDEALQRDATATECIDAMRRLGNDLRLLSNTTIETFVRRYMQTIAAQKGRLQRFGRILGHELRNPLNTLKLTAETLNRPEVAGDPERLSRMCSSIRRSVERARQVMEDVERLRDGIAIEPDDLPTVQEVDVGVVARDVVRQMQPAAEARGVEVRLDDELPRITIDASGVETALVNLIGNAIKYADPAKPRRFVEVAAGTPPTADVVTVDVVDNGIGIPEGERDRIFDPFHRVHSERDEELGNRGDGLGLAIVRDFIEELGGSITFESTEGEGSVFSLHLPRAPQNRR